MEPAAPSPAPIPWSPPRDAPDFGERYLQVGGCLGYITGGLTFIGSWIYCWIHYGFLFGFGLGWIPSAILAFIIGALTAGLWGLLALALAVALVALGWQMAQIWQPDPAWWRGAGLALLALLVFFGLVAVLLSGLHRFFDVKNVPPT